MATNDNKKTIEDPLKKQAVEEVWDLFNKGEVTKDECHAKVQELYRKKIFQQKLLDGTIDIDSDEEVLNDIHLDHLFGEDTHPFVPVKYEPIAVPVNKKQPPTDTQHKDFVDVSAFSAGAQNIILQGPWVNFWCQDCGRRLAPRSIHEHWSKAHDDLNNLAGLSNVAIHAMNKQLALTQEVKIESQGEVKTDTKRAAAATVTPTGKKKKPAPSYLFNRCTKSRQNNPFFVYVDSTPNPELQTKEFWMAALAKTTNLTKAQREQALKQIEAQYPAECPTK